MADEAGEMPAYKITISRTAQMTGRYLSPESAEEHARDLEAASVIPEFNWDIAVSAERLAAGSLSLPVRHPRVAWTNAITSRPVESQARCFATTAETFEAAVTERPYNNTMLSVRWCTDGHQAGTAAEGNERR
jgi:hypothetical protein